MAAGESAAPGQHRQGCQGRGGRELGLEAEADETGLRGAGGRIIDRDGPPGCRSQRRERLPGTVLPAIEACAVSPAKLSR